jgi:hypothetical protein
MIPAKKPITSFLPRLQTTLQTIVSAIGARWKIEEDFENTKDIGLDDYEVRSYVGWYRHITLVLLAYAFLVKICVQEARGSLEHEESNKEKKHAQASQPSSSGSAGSNAHTHQNDFLQESRHLSAHCEPEHASGSPPLIPLTTAEVRHLLARLIWPAPASVMLVRAWSSGSRGRISIGPAITTPNVALKQDNPAFFARDISSSLTLNIPFRLPGNNPWVFSRTCPWVLSGNNPSIGGFTRKEPFQ